MSGSVVVHPTKQALADASGERLLAALVDAQADGREAHLVLTGGSMGSAILTSLGALPAAAALDWTRVHLWWGDERFLPSGDPERNETQNREALLDRVPLDPAKVHAVPGPEGPDGDDVAAAAARYAAWLGEAAGDGADCPEFDVVLLGVGPDGHVASLFPGHKDQLVTGVAAAPVTDSPKPPPTRVTLTFEALARGRQVWFLVAGADKAQAVADGVSGAGPEVSSAAQVQGTQETLWLIDQDAAGQLPPA